MQLGMVGVGKMGGGMTERLKDAGHETVGYDIDPEISDVTSLEELVERLERPRHVWVMVPGGAPSKETMERLAWLLDPDDLVVQGCSSRWTEDEARAARLAENGIGYVDCGVAGGVWGPQQGYTLMAGGSAEHIERLEPVFDALKPPGDAGFVHAGPVGAGHYAKMVHSGIEYGLMESYAEGYELLQASDVVQNVPAVMASWAEGTIKSWVLDMSVRALIEDAQLHVLREAAHDSGEGRWTVEAWVESDVPTPAITAALYARFVSLQHDSPAMRLVDALLRPPPEGEA